jgi:stearoyl-CoA desaturase (Delta-9 desaturase)
MKPGFTEYSVKSVDIHKLDAAIGRFSQTNRFSGAMESTITQNGALYASQHAPNKQKKDRLHFSRKVHLKEVMPLNEKTEHSVATAKPKSASWPSRIARQFPFERINWTTSSFLIGTLALTLTAVPWYLWRFGLDSFQVSLFFVMLLAIGFSITVGYHRFYSHITFQASWPVRVFTLIFGAAAFENSALMWASDHRRHHKHVDHDDDPYSISKGFFYAHIGWLIFKLNGDPSYDNVPDLMKDKLVRWQQRYVQVIAVVVGFVLPAVAGALWNGWRGALAAFLIAGVARIVVLQHCTFLINSACHIFGTQPYSTRCSARDSWRMALLTMGEGYHNYHHEFQHDYRNGVKPWNFDPTKWIIWTLSKLGLARNLRRVPVEKNKGF